VTDTRQEFVEKLGSLPTLPFIAEKLLATLSDDRSSAVDVARVLMTDQSTSSRILRLANSAHFGLTRRIATVREAVVIIGYRQVRQLALGISIMDKFIQSAAGSFDVSGLWIHAVAVGCGARMLAHKVGVDREEAFLCGLLHDLGKTVLAVAKPEGYVRVLDMTSDGQTPVYRAEREVFGFEHSHVGAMVMEAWNLPAQMAHASRDHRDPDRSSPYSTYLALTNAGDSLARSAELGYPGDSLRAPMAPWVEHVLGLHNLRPEAMMQQITSETNERWGALGPEALA
jgi:putative nucleotidyltransferase with HDIG domain